MTAYATEHSTIVLARTFDVPAWRVYAALSDAAERRRAMAASDRAGTVIVLDEADFRVGGIDVYRFGSRIQPRFHGTSTYHDIAAGRRIVTTDTVAQDGVQLVVALSTIEIAPRAGVTQVKITAQLVRLDQASAIDGAEERYGALMDGLHRHLRASPHNGSTG